MVKITLKGTTSKLLRMFNTPDDSDDLVEEPFIISGVKIIINNGDEEEDITKQKGKYIKTKSYIKNIFNDRLHCDDNNRYIEVPIYTELDEVEFHFVLEDIDINHFNPEKLQLFKSDYEIEELPFGIIATQISYDGDTYKTVNDIEDYLDYLDQYDDRWDHDDFHCSVEIKKIDYELPYVK